MKRWIIPLLTILILVGCAPAIVQSVESSVGQNRTAQAGTPAQADAEADNEPTPDAPEPTLQTPDLPAFEIPDSAEAEAGNPLVPFVPEEELQAAAQSNNAFALDVFSVLRLESTGENIIYSPVSIYSAFAMLYAGASGDTAVQMTDVLHYNLDPGALHAALGAFDALLTKSGQEGFTLTIANALWGQSGNEFAPTYLDTLARYYGVALQTLDFARDSSGAAEAVNRWVSDATNGKIQSIVQGFDPDTALVLSNAIYLDADWMIPFEKDATRSEPFTAYDGRTREVDMMHVSDRFVYAEGSTYQMVALPYAGGTARMIVILPTDGEFSAFEEGLTTEQLGDMFSALDGRKRDVALSLPKFEYETTSDMVDVLQQLGLTLPFSDQADFTGINGRGGVTVDQAIHKARITVDEAGTEAAAATVISAVTLSAPLQADPVIMTVDRPFIYLIQDTQTGALLFFGRIVTLE